MAEGGVNRRDNTREENRQTEEGVYIYRRNDTREENRQTEEEELYELLEEVSLNERVGKGAKCESCVCEECPECEDDESARSENYERARQLYGRVAVFFCFLCKMFVCAECLPKHQWHEGMKVERKEGEGTGEQREREENKGLGKNTKRMRMEAESERKENKGKGVFAKIKKKLQKAEREESEREGKRRKFVVNLVNESERTEKFFTSHTVICDRVEVKHELDRNKDCDITGLCGLENKRLVVCDYRNSCIKIFKLGSHVIQRYIRFVGFGPRDVTEIDLKQNSTEQNLVSGSSSDISATDRADPDKQCLIAVTLPWKRQIMFIDLSKKPAKTQKVIQTEKECRSIQFYDDKIFTFCSEDPVSLWSVSLWSVYIYSTDGDKLNKFDIGNYGYFTAPHLAVVSGRVYLTDIYNDKVECRNVEGQVISEITIEGSRPAGISVDPDNNVYVCAYRHNKVYKLDADLTRYESVLDQTAGYIESPRALCYYRDKLFIGHDRPPYLGNFVTVVRLL